MGAEKHNPHIERLIKDVTERVLRGIEQPRRTGTAPDGLSSRSAGQEPSLTMSGSNPRPRNLLFLLPVATPNLARLARLALSPDLDGWRVRWLADDCVASEISCSEKGVEAGPRVEPISRAPLSSLLEHLSAGDMVVLASIGFTIAERLTRLRDDDPFVRVMIRAKLQGLRASVFCDDLETLPGIEGKIPTRARELLRDIEKLGLDVFPSAHLLDRLGEAASARGVAARSVGGLLTEAEIERIIESGERRLVLPSGTLVTPLARSRALAVGLELIEKGVD